MITYRALHNPGIVPLLIKNAILPTRQLRKQFKFNPGLSLMSFNTNTDILNELNDKSSMWNNKPLLKFDSSIIEEKFQSKMISISQNSGNNRKRYQHKEIMAASSFNTTQMVGTKKDPQFNLEEQLNIFNNILAISEIVYLSGSTIIVQKFTYQ